MSARVLYRSRRLLRLAAARLRAHLARLQGVRMGEKCMIEAGVRIERPWLLSLGSRCVIQAGVWIDVAVDDARLDIGDHTFIGRGTAVEVTHQVSIGRGCLIGPGVHITDHNHGMDAGVPMYLQPCPSAPVEIGDDVWLGARCVILPGTRLGDGCVVGAGAVVTRDVPAGAIVVGVPARIVGERAAASPSLSLIA